MSKKLIQKLIDVGDNCQDGDWEWGKGYDDGIKAAISIVEDFFKESELNENQQIVLDWLKDEYCDGHPFFTIWHTLEDRYFKESSDALLASQQIEILQAFSQWAIEQEEG